MKVDVSVEEAQGVVEGAQSVEQVRGNEVEVGGAWQESLGRKVRRRQSVRSLAQPQTAGCKPFQRKSGLGSTQSPP